MTTEQVPSLSRESTWSVYEAGVQAYRSLVLSAQAIYLAVGALLLQDDQTGPLIGMFVVAMVTSWYIGFPVIFARTAIVDFHKHALGSTFDARGDRVPEGEQPEAWLQERAYARTTAWGLRRRVYAGMRIEHPGFRTLRLTRLKLDVLLPGLMTGVWVVYLVSAAVR